MIVGAGICGSEAALACAAKGLDTLLVTTSLDTVYNLLGDGVKLEPREGTVMKAAFDKLAESGFLGNWDMHRYAKQVIETVPEIHFLQSNVSGLIVQDRRVIGVHTWEGVARYAKKVALTVGSFLRPRLTIGTLTEAAGRLSEMAYDDLYDNLLSLGFDFEPIELEAAFEDDSLPYSIDCQVFADHEKEGFRLTRLNDLYAAGVCAFGAISYEDAALQGRDLAGELSS